MNRTGYVMCQPVLSAPGMWSRTQDEPQHDGLVQLAQLRSVFPSCPPCCAQNDGPTRQELREEFERILVVRDVVGDLDTERIEWVQRDG